MAEENVNTKCNYHALHEASIKRHDHEIRDLDNRVTDNEKEIYGFNVELKEALKTLSKLPEAIQELTKSNIIIHNKVDASNEKISKLEKDINEVKDNIQKIDNESKINVRKDLTQNYTKIKGIVYVGVAIGGAALSYLINLLIKAIF